MSNVNEVVLVLWLHPSVLKIVNEEMNVLRYKVWLNRRQVDANNLRIGVFVANCNIIAISTGGDTRYNGAKVTHLP